MRRAILLTLLILSTTACDLPFGPGDDADGFAGAWTGTYKNTLCTETGAVPFPCSVLNGLTGTFSMTLSRSDSQVTGSFTVDSQVYPATSGTITADGTLVLTAAAQSALTATWTLTLDDDELTGTLKQVWGSSTNSYTVTGIITNSTRNN